MGAIGIGIGTATQSAQAQDGSSSNTRVGNPHTTGRAICLTKSSIVLSQYWKLKAIVSINVTCNGELPQDQFHRIIDTLITNQEIKDILLQQIKQKSPNSEEVKKDYDMIISKNPPVPIRPVLY